MHSLNKNLTIIAPTLGEAVQIRVLCRAIKDIDASCKLTVFVDEEGAFEVASKIKQIDRLFHLPSNEPTFATKYLTQNKPDLNIFVSFCYHPTILIESKKRGVKSILLSAMMNKDIANHPRYKKGMDLGVYSLFDYVGVKNADEIENFLEIGVKGENIAVTGDLKINKSNMSVSVEEKRKWETKLGLKGNAVIVAGSLSLNEGYMFIDVCRRLLEDNLNLKCILAPRFIKDIDEIELYAKKQKLNAERKSRLFDVCIKENNVNMIFLDTYGELAYVYSLCNIAFIGGTMMPFSDRPMGHNILEPLIHGKVIIVGPNLKKDKLYIEKLKSAWHGIISQDKESLYNNFTELLNNESLQQRLENYTKREFIFDDNIDSTRKMLRELSGIFTGD